MLQKQRQDKILECLAGGNYLSVEDAVRVFKSSPATIRRDFLELAESGQVLKVRGGVSSRKAQTVLPFSDRESSCFSEKEAIAKSAVSMICAGDVVFIDGGTTTFHMASVLPDMNIRIITNSLRLASALEERSLNARWEIYLTGGFLYTRSGILLGPNAQGSLAQYHANLAFLSVSGIDGDGVYNNSELVVDAERVMISNSDRTVIMADHTKIGKHGLAKVCELDKICGIITDRNVSSNKSLNLIRKKGVGITLVDV
jgi:DeoR/GlpR family transcriptional regulator of sugar metabolism